MEAWIDKDFLPHFPISYIFCKIGDATLAHKNLSFLFKIVCYQPTLGNNHIYLSEIKIFFQFVIDNSEYVYIFTVYILLYCNFLPYHFVHSGFSLIKAMETAAELMKKLENANARDLPQALGTKKGGRKNAIRDGDEVRKKKKRTGKIQVISWIMDNE
jgi:hypothetical protein